MFIGWWKTWGHRLIRFGREKNIRDPSVLGRKRLPIVFERMPIISMSVFTMAEFCAWWSQVFDLIGNSVACSGRGSHFSFGLLSLSFFLMRSTVYSLNLAFQSLGQRLGLLVEGSAQKPKGADVEPMVISLFQVKTDTLAWQHPILASKRDRSDLVIISKKVYGIPDWLKFNRKTIQNRQTLHKKTSGPPNRHISTQSPKKTPFFVSPWGQEVGLGLCFRWVSIGLGLWALKSLD